MPVATSFRQREMVPADQVPWRRVIIIPGGDDLLMAYFWRVPVWDEPVVRAATEYLPATGTMILASSWPMDFLVRAEESMWKRNQRVGSLVFHGRYDFEGRTSAQLVALCNESGATVHLLSHTYFDSFRSADEAWRTAGADLAGLTDCPVSFDGPMCDTTFDRGVASTKFDELILVGDRTPERDYPTLGFTAYALKG